jgi:hypothetical protein
VPSCANFIDSGRAGAGARAIRQYGRLPPLQVWLLYYTLLALSIGFAPALQPSAPYVVFVELARHLGDVRMRLAREFRTSRAVAGPVGSRPSGRSVNDRDRVSQASGICLRLVSRRRTAPKRSLQCLRRMCQLLLYARQFGLDALEIAFAVERELRRLGTASCSQEHAAKYARS